MRHSCYPRHNMHGDRRMRYERRQYEYSHYIPDRRSGKDRRDSFDLFQNTNELKEFEEYMTK